MARLGQAQVEQISPAGPQQMFNLWPAVQILPMHTPGTDYRIGPINAFQNCGIVFRPYGVSLQNQFFGPGGAIGEQVCHTERAIAQGAGATLAPLYRGVIAQFGGR